MSEARRARSASQGTAAAAETAGAPAPAVGRVHAMTVDVEEHFQVSAMDSVVDRADWRNHPARVDANVDRLLALFEQRRVRATFFTLGWVAARHRGMIRRIVDAGHELASHGLQHDRVHRLGAARFRADVRDSKALLEDLGGVAVIGYRAPSFSIDQRTPWAHEILAQAGYRYSSSVYPIRHDHYGMPDAPRFAYRPLADREFLEVPITTAQLLGRRLPMGGGGYFRLLPYAASRWGLVRTATRESAACVFYLHPWEVDPDQPRVPGLPVRARLRHYLNLSRTLPRLERLTRDFAWDRMDRVFPIHSEAQS